MIETETMIEVQVGVDLICAARKKGITTVPVTVAHLNLGGERVGIHLCHPRLITITMQLLKLISSKC